MARLVPSTTPTNRSLKHRLREGEKSLYGLFLASFSPTMAEIAGRAGYDFVVIDMEHGHGDIPDALSCLHALSATSTPAIIRLPENSATWAKKALDIGPQGLMFPMINDPESAQNAVAYCRYPPRGVRGAAHTAVRASNYGFDDEYLVKCEEELLIMCQVESVEAVERVKEIAAVDGVDCIMIGPVDLSASLGYLSDPGNSRVKESIGKAEKAVLRFGEEDEEPISYLAGFATPQADAVELKRRGYHMVCGGVDVVLFRDAVRQNVNKFKF